MMRPTINEESDCLRKKNLRRRQLNRFSRISQNFSVFFKNKLHHVCLHGNAFQQTKNEQNRNFERDRLMLDISGPSLLKVIIVF